MQSESTNELAAALSKAQGLMGAAKFDKVNPHFKSKYASLAAVVDALREPFAKNGLSYTQTTHVSDGSFTLTTRLLHASGQWIVSEYPLPMTAKPQELGSALTYARRYSLSAIAGIAADEDDDANAANGQTVSAQSAVKPQAVEAPINPATGDLSPHEIVAAGYVEWGGKMIAAIQTAKTTHGIEAWMDANQPRYDASKDAAPAVYKLVTKAIIDATKQIAA